MMKIIPIERQVSLLPSHDHNPVPVWSPWYGVLVSSELERRNGGREERR